MAVLRSRALALALLAGASLLAFGLGPCDSDEEDEPSPTATATAVASVGGKPEDPMPDSNEPGLVVCDGCPEPEGISDFEPDFGNASANGFSGRVARGAGAGRFFVLGDDGSAYGGNIPTDADGNWSVTVPLVCGAQTIKLAWANDRGTGGAVMRASTSGCRESDIRITLSWDDAGDDFELHLVREGGAINDNAEDCTWTSCIGQSPDWGREGDASDNPSKDVDDVDAFGPENIVYPGAAEGRYTVLVEHWGLGRPGATGSVVINVRGHAPVELPIRGLDPQHVLVVATIDWPSGEVRPVQTGHDCSANWAGGCRDRLP